MQCHKTTPRTNQRTSLPQIEIVMIFCVGLSLVSTFSGYSTIKRVYLLSDPHPPPLSKLKHYSQPGRSYRVPLHRTDPPNVSERALTLHVYCRCPQVVAKAAPTLLPSPTATPAKQCLTSNLKFDALALGEEAVSLLFEVHEETACLALR